jgi:hypothetical protein
MERDEVSDGELLAATASRPDAFAAFYDRYETAVVGYRAAARHRRASRVRHQLA